MTTKSPLEAARTALEALDADIATWGGAFGRNEATRNAADALRALIESDRPERPEMRVLTIPSAGVRVGMWEPRHTFEKLTELLATGYTFDEMEWES